jgi:hypothetical protein
MKMAIFEFGYFDGHPMYSKSRSPYTVALFPARNCFSIRRFPEIVFVQIYVSDRKFG